MKKKQTRKTTYKHMPMSPYSFTGEMLNPKVASNVVGFVKEYIKEGVYSIKDFEAESSAGSEGPPSKKKKVDSKPRKRIGVIKHLKGDLIIGQQKVLEALEGGKVNLVFLIKDKENDVFTQYAAYVAFTKKHQHTYFLPKFCSKLLSEYLGVKRVSCFGVSAADLCGKLDNLLPKDQGAVSMYLYPGALTAENFHTMTFVTPKVRRVEI